METKDLKEFKKALKEGKVTFSYKKVNGEVREAVGTLNGKFSKNLELYKSKKEITQTTPGVLRYYDLNSDGWRSFLEENFIEMTKVEFK